ncbi:MAG: DUF4983 domain-containing protein [Niabella sp.]
MKYSFIIIATLLIIIFGSVTSCKKYADNPAVFETYDSTASGTDRRVLVIAIDGLNAEVFKAAATPNYTALLSNAKYTWDSKADILSTDASSWKTLTSGVTYGSHHIADSTFAQSTTDYTGELEDYTTAQNYPSLFNFLLRTKYYSAQTTFITSWQTLLDKAVTEARNKIYVADDVVAKDSAVSVAKTTSSKVVFVNFNGPAKIVKDPSSTATFSASSDEYEDALTTVDGYIGEIMDALKSRANYNTSEEWLVVVTGTHGGVDKTYGGTSDEETTVPTCYYFRKFTSEQFTREGALSSVLMKGSSYNTDLMVNATTPSSDAFNPGTGEFTIQLNIKGNKAPTYYPHFLSKTLNWTSSTPSGWTFYTSTSGYWSFSAKGPGGSRKFETALTTVFDDSWHTLTVVIYDTVISGSTMRYLKRFTDGARIADPSPDITAFGDISNDLDLILGFGGDDHLYGGNQSSTGLQFYANNIEMFNTALTDAEVAANICLQDITEHPKYAYLTAYWPGTDGIGNTIANQIDNSSNFEISGSYAWDALEDFPCSFSQNIATGLTTKFLKNVDISAQIFYWLGLTLPTTWETEGSIWLDAYESEFVSF